MQAKLKEIYLKLLKASIKNKRNKMLKLEDKLIQLELDIRKLREKQDENY
jgi:predicted  nucleic acid-binding Zn-ribbon protein